MNYDWVTLEMMQLAMEKIVASMDISEILSIPEISGILLEALNNEILEEIAATHPDAEWQDWSESYELPCDGSDWLAIMSEGSLYHAGEPCMDTVYPSDIETGHVVPVTDPDHSWLQDSPCCSGCGGSLAGPATGRRV